MTYAPKYRKKTYIALRYAMRACQATNNDLGQLLEKSPTWVNNRMNGSQGWPTTEAWAVMAELGLPREEFHYYFPANIHEVPPQWLIEQQLNRQLRRSYTLESKKPAFKPASKATSSSELDKQSRGQAAGKALGNGRPIFKILARQAGSKC